MESLSAPEPLNNHHDLSIFASGETELDDWLARRALANQISGASRTYVLASENRVIGYYVLANGSLVARKAPGRVRRNMYYLTFIITGEEKGDGAKHDA